MLKACLAKLDCVTLIASQLIAQDVYTNPTMTHCAWTYLLVYDLIYAHRLCALQIICHLAKNANI